MLGFVIAVVCALGGLLITVYVDLPPGGVIVLLTIGVYVLGLVTKAVTGRVRRKDPAATAPAAAPEHVGA